MNNPVGSAKKYDMVDDVKKYFHNQFMLQKLLGFALFAFLHTLLILLILGAVMDKY